MNRSALIVLGSLVSFALVVIIGCGGGSSKSTGPGASGPSFDFTFPATGVSHEFTFNDAGTWDYHCRNHGGMIGAVTVSAGSAVDSVVVTVGPGNTLSFSPTPATIKVGGKVRWVNGSSMTNHTVTRP